MSQKDKIKLVVAIVVLVGAGVLIWWNVREPSPEAPKQGSFTSAASPSGGQAQPAPTSGAAPMPNGGRGQVKK